MKRLTDPSFSYVPSHLTNIRETFEKHRANEKELKAAAQAEAKQGSEIVSPALAAPVRLLRKAGR